MKTRAIVSHGAGLEQLELVERSVPRPGPGQVLLRMRAASVALRDHKMATGAYGAGEARAARVLGGEGVGEVIELGAGVTQWRIGDRVNPLFVQHWTEARAHPEVIATSTLGGPRVDGTFADQMLVPAESLVAVPAHLSDVEAATLPFAGLTAWCAVREQAATVAGDVVVVQGTGGISLYALQFARMAGAHVIVTSKNDDKLARARALGAAHTINYQTVPEWSAAVLALTNGRGADLVLDPGGTVTMAQSLRALRPGGMVSVFNALGGPGGSPDIAVSLPWLLGHNLRVQGSNAGSLLSHRAMNRAVADAGLRPVIEQVLPFDAGITAIAAAPKSEQFGKVCLQMD
jgi:NADPH:quinone reductase-like Zn-dependent oxidoreductase